MPLVVAPAVLLVLERLASARLALAVRAVVVVMVRHRPVTAVTVLALLVAPALIRRRAGTRSRAAR